MSLKFIVEFRGKRTSVSVTPMAPVQKLLEEACQQQKPPLAPSMSRLLYQKKVLDPSTPVRFANLPKEAKLELVTDQPERRLGLADNATASTHAETQAANTALAAPIATSAVEPAAGHQPAGQSASHPQHIAAAHAAPSSTGPSASTQNAAAASSTAEATTSTQSSAAAPHVTPLDRQAKAAEQSTQQSASMIGQNAQQAQATALVAHGLDRDVQVFTREAAAAAEASKRGDMDLPDDFYDFTPDDYQKVMSGWAKRHSQAAAPLKTQKLRDQDERRRAEQIGPVPIRIHFPDGLIVQADFKALEPLSAVQTLVQQCVQPSVLKWHLYITPPKQVLKEPSLTLYKAGLVPAANVFIGVDGQHAGPLLRPQIAALQASPPARVPPKAAESSSHSQAGIAKAQGVVGSQFLPSSKAIGSSEKKVPKWMKIGK